MPINHWLSPYMMEHSAKAPSIPTATFWASSASPRAVAFRLNLNNEDEEEEPAAVAMDDGGESDAATTAKHHLSKEPLFEKPLTPSDVGKLNRLVIPKQHAEKYFPLNGGGGEKGLLLGFEDEAGKSWRFRYSYWNSSQSYVLTKGWSRFVKEKRLDAGDIVLFARHPNDLGRLFIGWRRRSGGGGQDGAAPPPPCVGGGWSGLLYAAHPYPIHSSNSSVLYQTDCPHAENIVKERNGNSKRMRLFGVNLEWDDDERERDPEPEPEPSTLDSGKGEAHEEPYYSSHRRSGHTVSYVCDSANI